MIFLRKVSFQIFKHHPFSIPNIDQILKKLYRTGQELKRQSAWLRAERPGFDPERRRSEVFLHSFVSRLVVGSTGLSPSSRPIYVFFNVFSPESQRLTHIGISFTHYPSISSPSICVVSCMLDYHIDGVRYVSAILLTVVRDDEKDQYTVYIILYLRIFHLIKKNP